ncbi:MAG: hypothetical protein N2C14_06210, partial [Planctomycetales bacterium]
MSDEPRNDQEPNSEPSESNQPPDANESGGESGGAPQASSAPDASDAPEQSSAPEPSSAPNPFAPEPPTPATTPRTSGGAVWKTFKVTAVLVLVFAVGWLLPRWRQEIHTVHNTEQSWEESEAPTRKQIVWETPDQIEGLLPKGHEKDSLIRPHFAAFGTVLYFTLRDP